MEKKRVKSPLSRTIALRFTAFAFLLSAALIASSYLHYKTEMYEKFEQFAMNIAAVAASHLNPDKISTYLETGQKDEEYEHAYQILCQIREKGGIEYLYVVKPEIDEVWYVMDTDPSEGAIPLGFHEPYYKGAFAENAEKMSRGESIPPIVSNEEYGWLMSVYYPMFTTTGESAGYVGVDIGMNEVMEDLQQFTIRMMVLMLVVTGISLSIMIFISAKTIADPIRKLSNAAEQLVEAEQAGTAADTEIFRGLTIRSKDEIGELYQSLSQMEQDMNAYIRDVLAITAEKERITSEMSLASRIQSGMLPHIFPPFPDHKEFDIYATMTPAKEVGGDFYDFYLVDDDHLCAVIADVSGKGVPGALFMMVTKIILQSCAMLGSSAAEILTKTNDTICTNNQAEMFVTVWVGILELSTGRLTVANAGHEYPVLKRAGGSFELMKDKHGLVIGAMEGIRYKEYEIQMNPGDRIFVYTDGVTEATDMQNQLFGTGRMLASLNANRDASGEDLLRNLKQDIDTFVGEASQFDDVTMMTLLYNGSARQNKGE
ncbi:MAG: SpoIIE family protein phosphatase [Oscillospiraceae bacterium]|nr:SpoIIE family protein phosphatase [Oscillospiraceae bacterium]